MRILLVSYYFPPYNSVGAVRPGKLARYLHERGHDVHVLSCAAQPFPPGLPVELPEGHVSYTPAWSINAPVEWLRGGRAKVAREGFSAGLPQGSGAMSLGRLYKTLLHWPDAQPGWVRHAIRRGRAVLRGPAFDLIYASAPPFSGLRVAASLAAEFRLPWVAEFRDLWTDNHAYAEPAWRAALERRWEKSLLQSAAALVTVSPPLAGKLQRFGKPVWEIRNGCDPEDFVGLAAPAGFGEDPGGLDIAFTGNVYGGHYDVDTFCSGLSLYAAQGGRARVHVAGRNTGALRDAAHAHGVAPFFSFASVQPRATALAMQASADVLLAFLWQGPQGEGVYSAKLFEYAGAGRPVLAVGDPASGTGHIVEASGLGKACADAQAVAGQLLAWREEKSLRGSLHAQPAPGHDFTRRTQFALLESHLAGLLAGGG